jgi:cytidine deaminase
VRAQALLREADAARRAAYAPYSRFAVGAALLTASGRIVHGCNVENESLGLTICAERNAVGRAVASGERRFVAIAVSAGVRVSASPCGACRQVLHELAPEIRVIWRGRGGRIMNRRLTALLPHAFERTT